MAQQVHNLDKDEFKDLLRDKWREAQTQPWWRDGMILRRNYICHPTDPEQMGQVDLAVHPDGEQHEIFATAITFSHSATLPMDGPLRLPIKRWKEIYQAYRAGDMALDDFVKERTMIALAIVRSIEERVPSDRLAKIKAKAENAMIPGVGPHTTLIGGDRFRDVEVQLLLEMIGINLLLVEEMQFEDVMAEMFPLC